jgi:hypothetical protein
MGDEAQRYFKIYLDCEFSSTCISEAEKRGIPRNCSEYAKVIAFLSADVNGFNYWTSKKMYDGERTTMTLFGNFPENSDETFGRGSFLEDSALCVHHYRRMKSDSGKPCWVEFGSAKVPFESVHKLLSMPREKDFPCQVVQLTMPTVEGLSTASVILRRAGVVGVETDSKSRRRRRERKSNVTSNASENEIASYDPRPHFSKWTNLSSVGSAITIGGITPSPFDVRSSAFASEGGGGGGGKGTAIRDTNHRIEASTYQTTMLENYFKKCSLESDVLGNWLTGGADVKCPVYPSQVTVGDKLFLPYCAFTITEPVSVAVTYWKNALIVMASRRGYGSILDYRAAYFGGAISLETKAVHAMDMVCQLAHCMEYVTDQVVDRKGKVEKIEIFGDGLLVYGDDCDGLSHAVYECFDDFVLGQRDEFESLSKAHSSPEYAVLTDMRSILAVYVPFLCIEGVTSPSAQNRYDSEDEAKKEITGAHAAVKCVPAWYFQECVARWNSGHPIAGGGSACERSYEFKRTAHPGKVGGPFVHLPERDYGDRPTTKRDAKHYGDERDDYDGGDGWTRLLPLLLGEGTGMLNSGGESDPCGDPKTRSALVYSCKALKCSKKPLYPPKGTSPFYKAVMFASTNRFLKEHRVGTFYFCTSLEGTDSFSSSKKYSRGVRFSDLVSMRDNVAIVPHGDVFKDRRNEATATPEFSEPMMYLMRRALLTRQKSRPVSPSDLPPVIEFDYYQLSESEDSKKAVLFAGRDVLERGYAALREMKDKMNLRRAMRTTEPERLLSERTEISVYLDPFYANKELCEGICSHFREKKKNVIVKFALESLTDKLLQWRLTFGVKKC